VVENTQVPDGQGYWHCHPFDPRPGDGDFAPGAAGSGGTYREALAIGHKIANLRWKDGTAVANVNQNELGPRRRGQRPCRLQLRHGALLVRFKLPPDVPFGNAGTANSYGSIPNVHAFYANGLWRLSPNTIPAIQE